MYVLEARKAIFKLTKRTTMDETTEIREDEEWDVAMVNTA